MVWKVYYHNAGEEWLLEMKFPAMAEFGMQNRKGRNDGRKFIQDEHIGPK